MLKWILGAAACGILICGFVVWQHGAVKTAYVNGLAPYNELPGREFILERDCYIFKFRGHDTLWPLIGSNSSVPQLPAEVDARKVGADLPDIRILGIARVGDRFRIVSVRRDVSREGENLTFEILFSDEADRPYPRLDAFWIMDHAPEKSGGAPGIRPEYAVPRVKI